MIVWQILGGFFGLLLLFVVFETLKNMIARESETRLERLPFAILRLARRRLPPEHREAVHDEEWLPELLAIVHATEGLPVTRLVRGVHFAVGLVLSARAVSRSLGGLRRRAPAAGRRIDSPMLQLVRALRSGHRIGETRIEDEGEGDGFWRPFKILDRRINSVLLRLWTLPRDALREGRGEDHLAKAIQESMRPRRSKSER